MLESITTYKIINENPERGVRKAAFGGIIIQPIATFEIERGDLR